MEKEYTKIIAYLLSDGGLSIEGEMGLYMYLRSMDKALLEDFEKSLASFRLKPYRKFYRRAFQSKVGSKEVSRKLLAMCNTFRTLKCEHSPTCSVIRGTGRQPCLKCVYPGQKESLVELPIFVTENKGNIAEFLKVFASTEGHVRYDPKRKTRRMIIGCAH